MKGGNEVAMGESRAAVLVAPGQVEIQSFPLPEIGDDDGLLKVECTGVCGTDWAAYQGSIRAERIPFVLGHEVAGRIVAIGPKAADRWGVAVGDRVVVEEYLPCGYCRHCLMGDHAMCTEGRIGGTSIHQPPSLWGGFSEYLYLSPKSLVHRIEGDLDPELAQLFIPISNGIYWAGEVGSTRVGSTVLVLGPGPHGLGAVIGAREAGAGRVIVVGRETDGYRLQTALDLGADHALRLEEGDVVQRVRELTRGAMADVVINTANSPAALGLALTLAGERATVVQAGIAGQNAHDVPVDQIFQKKLTIKGVRGRPTRIVPAALRVMASGRYPLARMCTHRFPLAQTEEALRLLGGGGDGVCRICVMGE